MIFPRRDEKAVQRHLKWAGQAARNDLDAHPRLGNTGLAPLSASQISRSALIQPPVPPPGRALDKPDFVGARWVHAWIIPTSDGLILVVALNSDDAAGRVIDAGMRRPGLDPTGIGWVVVTRGHGDHPGGIGPVRRVAWPRVIQRSG